MSNYNDKKQEGLVDYVEEVRKTFEGKKEEDMKFVKEEQNNFSSDKPIYLKNVKPGTQFKITGEPKYRGLESKGKLAVLDKDGQQVFVWDIPVNMDGKEVILDIYNSVMENLRRSVDIGDDGDSNELIGLNYEVVLEQSSNGKYYPTVNLIK